MEAKFSMLLEPFQIGQVKLKNRMVKVATAMFCADMDGTVNETVKTLYEAWARGGVGMITTEATYVDYPLGTTPGLPMLGIYDDKFIPGLSELTEVMHKHGCPTFLQIQHVGPAHIQAITGLQPVSASALSDDERRSLSRLTLYPMARELTVPEIEDIVDKFAKAAERAQKAGFDGVEVHGGHSYLLNSFLSRAYNKRQDAYGCQDLESRTRMLVGVIRAIKERCGQDFPVGAKINGIELGVKNGITSEESQATAQIVEKAGANYIIVSGFGYGDFEFAHTPEQLVYPEPPEAMKLYLKIYKKPGILIPPAEAIKKVVSIPVTGVGRLSPELGEWLLENGKVDLISMGRWLFADPELPNKLAAGRPDDIRRCVACHTCSSIMAQGKPVRCRINAALGREREYVIKPAKKNKRIMVVGGGPAGMEAARVAALRGHEVILYEREHELGGLMPIAALIKGPAPEDLTPLIRYFKTQLTKLGVQINLGKAVNLALVEEIKPDVVIIATGGRYVPPEILGIVKSNVVSSSDLQRRVKPYLRFFGPNGLNRLTKYYLPFGKRVVIIGGLIHGCEAAKFLVKRDRKVTILETSKQLGIGVPIRNYYRLLDWLAKKGVTMLTEVKYEEIIDKGITITTKEGKRQFIEADTVLIALPFKPNTELFNSLKGKVPEVYQIGDCKEPNLIIDAIADGSRIGLDI